MNHADEGSGSGAALPLAIQISATTCGLLAAVISSAGIYLHLRNYRKPFLQRHVVRILFMVPIYSLSSCISLFSAEVAFFVDALRDVYEAFVIYCFFQLLIEYLGGERSLIIALLGRPLTSHLWPVNYCLPSLDVSDPFSFLGLKRGILQYVQIKPVLALLTMILKASGNYTEGTLQANNGYTYISVVYNISVAVSLYCLVLFWTATHSDLKPFRPTPKFLCVKGIIFALFWQSFAISILVSAGAIRLIGYNKENLSLAVSDMIVCYEMPLFAIMHLYAFSTRDYIDDKLYAGRMPVYYALRDCFGLKDIFQDSLITYKGTAYSYKTFEPSEGGIHHGRARERRFKAGLRYANGGKTKYWLPMPGAEYGEAYGRKKSEGAATWRDFIARPVEETTKLLEEARRQHAGYAPLAPEQAEQVIHTDETEQNERNSRIEGRWEDHPNVHKNYDSSDSDTEMSLEFSEESDLEDLFDDARKLEFGDYNFPVTDASREEARRRMRDEEDAILFDRPRSKQPSKSDGKGKGKQKERQRRKKARSTTSSSPVSTRTQDADTSVASTILPDGCIDLVVEDRKAEEKADSNARRRGEANELGGKERKVFRKKFVLDVDQDKNKGDGDMTKEVAVEREGVSMLEADHRVVDVSDHHDMTEETKGPSYVQESGFVEDEEHSHAQRPTREDHDNPWS